MIGRESELSELQQRWMDVAERRSQAVVLRGEPGVGKTRLVDALLSSFGIGGAARITLQCRLEANTTPLVPLARAVSRLSNDELVEVLVEFSGDDKLIQLLPNGGFIELIGLHDAIDGPEDVTFKEVLDKHRRLGLRNQLECPVVVF